MSGSWILCEKLTKCGTRRIVETLARVATTGAAIMPIGGSTYTFSQKNISRASSNPGVYALLDGVEIIYYGRATKSIQDRLQDHFDGSAGSCTKGATGYKRQDHSNPVAREKALLTEYVNGNGRLPRCNDVMP